MSNQIDSEPAGEAGGIRTSAVEAVVALLLLALGIIVVVNSLALGAGWNSDGPGPGYFPFYTGLILAVSGTAIFCQTVFAKTRDRSVFVGGEELKRVLSVLIPAIVYVLAICLVGIYVASAVYIALFMMVLGRFSALKSIFIGVLINVVFFMMFEVWFRVPLYKGWLEPLGFLGY